MWVLSVRSLFMTTILKFLKRLFWVKRCKYYPAVFQIIEFATSMFSWSYNSICRFMILSLPVWKELLGNWKIKENLSEPTRKRNLDDIISIWWCQLTLGCLNADILHISQAKKMYFWMVGFISWELSAPE